MQAGDIGDHIGQNVLNQFLKFCPEISEVSSDYNFLLQCSGNHGQVDVRFQKKALASKIIRILKTMLQ